MTVLKAMNGLVFGALRQILIAGVSILVVGLFLQIVLRYVFAESIDIIDEASRYLFVWLMFLTISVGFRENSHMGVSFLLDRLPPRGQRTLRILISVLLVVFFVAMAVAGWRMTVFTMRQLSSTMLIPMGYVYLAAPVGAGLCLLAVAELLLEALTVEPREGSK